MYTVIAFKEILNNGVSLRIYDDSTEKSFEEYEDSLAYSQYLNESNIAKGISIGVDVYQKPFYTKGTFDVLEFKKQEALNKLTEEEKSLLGLNS